MAWIDDVTDQIAPLTDVDPHELRMSPDLKREILDVARIAAHESGERINAPFLCYVLGVAVGKGASLEELAAPIHALDSEPTG